MAICEERKKDLKKIIRYTNDNVEECYLLNLCN